jgi:signal peptidase I
VEKKINNMTNLIKQKFGAEPNFRGTFPIIIIGLILIAILYVTNVVSIWSTIVMLVLWLVLIQGNLEVFLIAFIMAMIIRCFSIEVYKIPTGSMEPTLHGDYVDGDRIIADKFTLLFRKIKRFDVLLFRFPMDKTTNFIKRVVGLPDEELMIKRGDIYFRPKGTDKFIIAKKPLDTQESIWIEFGGYKWDGSETSLVKAWELPEGDSCKIEKGKVYLQGNNIISYKDSIKDKYPWYDGRHNVSDIKLSFRIKVDQNGGEISSTIKTPFGYFSLDLFPVLNGESPNLMWHFRAPPSDMIPRVNTLEHYLASGHPIKSLPIDVMIEPGKEYFIEILNFDGSIYIKINKKVVQQYDYITFLENSNVDRGYSNNQIILGIKKNTVQLWDFKIVRDIYYADDSYQSVLKENEPLVIPNNKYFVIGDNVPNSKDSRIWRLKKITLKNGKVVKCDAEPSYPGSYQDDGQIIKILRDKKTNRGGDIWGVNHTINRADLDSIDEEAAPFIDVDEIFGEALFVYWPLLRVKFIR